MSPRNLTTRRYVLPQAGGPGVMSSPRRPPGPTGRIGEARQVGEDVRRGLRGGDGDAVGGHGMSLVLN